MCCPAVTAARRDAAEAVAAETSAARVAAEEATATAVAATRRAMELEFATERAALERAAAATLERELLSARHTLAARSAELDALQREMTRLRQRAEASELRLSAVVATGEGHGTRACAAGAPIAAAAEHQAIVADLHARLRHAEDRSLRGEALVGKLRAFVAHGTAVTRL